MKIAIPLFDGFTAIDAVGPYEVLWRLPGAELVFAASAATSHWRALPALARFGAIPTQRRVVRAGKIFTSAGATSGIDLALTLAAELSDVETAQAIQLAIEYDPQPPFDSGSPAKAPLALVERLSQRSVDSPAS